jgi:integrase
VPRPRKQIPDYQLHRHTGQARVRIDGKDHWLGPFGSEESKQKYQELVRDLVERRAREEVKRSAKLVTNLTIAELVKAYLLWAKSRYMKEGQPTTEYSNIVSTVRLLLKQHSHELVSSFGPVKLMAIRDEWADQGIVRNQINHRVNRIKRLFKWGVSRELIPVEALQRLAAVEGLVYGQTKAPEGRKVTAVTDDMIDAVKPFVARQVWALISLQRVTGMRSSEVCSIRTADLDTSGETWFYEPVRHKTQHAGKKRRVALGPEAREILKPWLRLDLEEYLFQPKEAMAEWRAERRAKRKTKVQPSQAKRKRLVRPAREPGDHYTEKSYRRAVADACDRAFPHPTLSERQRRLRSRSEKLTPEQKAKLTPEEKAELREWRKVYRWFPHQIRHAMAERLRSEFGEEHVKAVLGHSSLNVAQMYGKRDERRAIEAAEKIG